MFSRVFAIVFFASFIVIQASGQEVAVRGKFLTDSIKIGQPIPFSLTARYPSRLNILFPDTSFSFAPFEVQRKKFFQTKTVNQISYDSAVYFLTTYEIDSVQKLQLPVFVVQQKDCTKVYSNTSTIFLKQLVKARYDSVTTEKLPLKINTDYLNVRWLLNYPLISIIAGIFIVALIITWIVFGKRILRHFAIRRLTKRHADFITSFTQAIEQLHREFSPVRAESTFVLWKKYMENLVAQPYTRFTAKEILRLEHHGSLGPTLRAINRTIYAGVKPPQEEDPFVDLKSYTEEQYVSKLEAIKHG